MELFFPLMLVLLIGVFFMSSRANKKRQKAMAEMQEALTPGVRVQLTSGLFGTVVAVTEADTVEIEVAPGVVTTWARLAVHRVITEDGEVFTDDEIPGDDLIGDDLIDDELLDDDSGADTTITLEKPAGPGADGGTADRGGSADKQADK